MSAKEMFEDLGYKQVKNMHKELGLIIDEKNIIYETEQSFTYFYILFELNNKRILKYSYPYGNCFITNDEFQAIHHQLKELGWLDE